MTQVQEVCVTMLNQLTPHSASAGLGPAEAERRLAASMPRFSAGATLPR